MSRLRILSQSAVASLAAVALLAPVASAQRGGPPGETILTNPPPPLVQGAPGEERLICGVGGPALSLGDGVYRRPARGELKTLMLFVDYPDAPADDADPEATYDSLVPPAQEALRELSGNRLQLTVDSPKRWIRVPKPLADYGFTSGSNITTHDQHHDMIADAVAAADPTVDFSGYTAVYVVAAPNAQIPQAASSVSGAERFAADGAKLRHGVTLSGSTFNFPAVLVHETGHVLGLPDLYAVGKQQQDAYVGPWDIMADTSPDLYPMLTWTRLAAGWLPKRDFRCMKRSGNVTLTPIGRRGTKALVVRAGPTTAYVAEARNDSVGYGLCRRPGVLVYKVDTTGETGRGPIRIKDAQAGSGSCGRHTDAPFSIDGRSYRSPDGKVKLSVVGDTFGSYDVSVKLRR